MANGELIDRLKTALQHAHRHSVVNRDIKPDNVMLSEDHATPSGGTAPVGTVPISAVARTKKIALAAAGVLVVAACSGSPTEVDPEVLHVPRPEVVLGIYLNAFAAGAPDRLATLLDLADNSALNTFVIDVKERAVPGRIRRLRY